MRVFSCENCKVFNRSKAGLFESSFFWGVSIWPHPHPSSPFIFQEELVSILLYTICKQPIEKKTEDIICYIIWRLNFFVTWKCKKIRKIDENSYYWRRKSSYFLNDVKNFNEIFRNDGPNGKKSRLHPLCQSYIFGKIISFLRTRKSQLFKG